MSNELPPSNAELRRLIANTSGGYRSLDPSGNVQMHSGRADGAHLCKGHADGIEWLTAGDAEFTARVSPYVVHLLLTQLESAKRRDSGALSSSPPGEDVLFPWWKEESGDYEVAAGEIAVLPNGSLLCKGVGDGVISKAAALQLALVILQRQLATLPPAQPSAP